MLSTDTSNNDYNIMLSSTCYHIILVDEFQVSSMLTTKYGFWVTNLSMNQPMS